MNKPLSSPPLVAHRGYQKHYPENTLLAMSQAIQAGSTALEIDVQVTADDVPVLFHDHDLGRMTGHHGDIHRMTSQQLQDYRAHEPGRFGDTFKDEPIATLDEFVSLLEAYPNVEAFVEIKPENRNVFSDMEILEPVLAALKPIHDRISLISFSIPLMAKARVECSRKIGVVLTTWDEYNDHEVQMINPDVVFINQHQLPQSGSIALPDTELVVYELDDPVHAKELIERGADRIETFAVGEMIDAW